MGLEYRDYMQASYEPRRPWRAFTVLPWLIALTALFYIAQLAVPGVLESILALYPRDVTGKGFVWQLLTSVFLHDPHSPMHILMNMLLLYWLGRQVERLYGWKKFLGLYLGGGVVASLSFVVIELLRHGLQGSNPVGSALGASGAVFAVAVVAAIYYPRQIVYLLFIPVPLFALVGIYVTLDLFRTIQDRGGGIATAAHVGGAAFGVLFWWVGTIGLRVPKRKSSMAAAFPSCDDDERELDRILDKISHEGMTRLTRSERKFLDRYSRRRSAR